MNTPDEIRLAEERQIEHELSELGIRYDALSSRLQSNGRPVLTLTVHGRSATGTCELFMHALDEVRNYKTPLSEALEARALYSSDDLYQSDPSNGTNG